MCAAAAAAERKLAAEVARCSDSARMNRLAQDHVTSQKARVCTAVSSEMFIVLSNPS